MYFALSADDLMLHVFASIEELAGYCEPIDVENDGWRFWNETGVALVPRFTQPVVRSAFVVGGGRCILEVDESGSRLAAELHRAEGLNTNVFFESLGDVRKQFGE
jgi:hypothetical protein